MLAQLATRLQGQLAQLSKLKRMSGRMEEGLSHLVEEAVEMASDELDEGQVMCHSWGLAC